MADSRGANIYYNYLSFYICIGTLLYQLVSTNAMKAEVYTTQSFELVRTSPYPHFVMFYAPWCGHCKRIQSLWDKFAAENHKTRRMKIAKVDCTTTTLLCAAENIKAYPTFLLFNKQEKYTFRGNRDIPDFTQFVNNLVTNLKDGQVPVGSTTSNIKVENEDNTPVFPKILTKETFQSETDHDYTFVDFYAPWCSHCNKLEPTWNKLADTLKYNKKITIAKVDCTADPELCQSHNINGYPTLNLYKDGYLVTPYTAGRSLSNLVSFIQTHFSNEENNDGSAQDLFYNSEGENGNNPPSTQGDENIEPTENIEIKLTDETFKEIMAKTQHLIYFHDSGPQFSNMDLLIFEQVQHRIKFLHYDTSVAVIDCSKTTLVCTELGIDIYPSIMYFHSLGKYTKYYGMIDVEKLVEFVVKQKEDEVKDESKEEL